MPELNVTVINDNVLIENNLFAASVPLVLGAANALSLGHALSVASCLPCKYPVLSMRSGPLDCLRR
jgi:hypothetical protein